MMALNGDAVGFYGDVLRWALSLALLGSSLIVFFYLWRKGRLDMDEEPKIQMLNADEDQPCEDNDE